MNRLSPVLTLSLVSVVLAALHGGPAAAQTSSSSQDVQLYGGEMFGDRLMETPLSGSTPRLNDNVTFGGRYTYNFMKQLGIQLSAGYTPTRAAHVASGGSDLGLTTVDLDAVWYVIPDYSLAGHKFSAYTEAGVGYAWVHLNHDLFGFAADRPVTITDSNGYTANAGLGAKYYLWDNFFVDLDARYRYLSKLTNADGQGLNTAETTLSLGYQF
jgi:opacity protein-like surface antigen